MLYHYTSTQALEGKLRESPSEKGLCFWASRYDCFGDKEEYKIGIETIKALLPKVENKDDSELNNYNKTNKITRLVTNLTYVAIVFGQSPPE